MEEVAWKKDETPYLVFSCTKCNGFTYAKTTQKQKKCPRCRRLHLVSNLIGSGEIVNGISVAVERMKEKQNELAIKELGSSPEFSSLGDFRLHNSLKTKKREIETFKNCVGKIKIIKKFKVIRINSKDLENKRMVNHVVSLIFGILLIVGIFISMYTPYDYYDTIALHDYTYTVLCGLLLIVVIEIHRSIEKKLKRRLKEEKSVNL